MLGPKLLPPPSSGKEGEVGSQLASLLDMVACLQAQHEIMELRLAALETRDAGGGGPAPTPLAPPPSPAAALSRKFSGSLGASVSVPLGSEEEEDAEMLDYQLGTTLWDAPAFIGLPELGGMELSAILLMSTLLNAVAQSYLVWVLLDSESFVRQDKWQRLKVSTRRWRDNEAHQYSQIDAGGTSLAARVCGLDDALSIAGKQSGMLVEINNYVGLEGSSLGEATRFPTGPCLCTVCLFLWVVVIARELRQLATYLLAMLSLPRGTTEFSGGKLLRVSRTRVTFIVAMCLVRLLVALALCYAGVMWLSHTSSVVDLILNAAALTFVLDLDEMLLETTVPAVVHRFLAELKPVHYRSPVFYVEALVPMVLIIVMVATSVGLLVLPNMEEMRQVKEEMCGGMVDFAMSQNGAGFAAALITTPFVENGGSLVGITERAVQDIRTRHGKNDTALTTKSNFSLVAATRDSFRSFQEISREDFARLTGSCKDKDVIQDGKRKLQRPFWFTTVTAETKGGVGREYDASSWRCEDYLKYCDTVAVVRTVCPKTCGCDDPLSGQIYNSAELGVPTVCLDGINASVADEPCSDAADIKKEEWARWWRAYRANAIFKDPRRAGDPVFESFISSKILNGCNDTSPDPFFGHGFCDDAASYLVVSRIASPRRFCLRTCCRGAAQGTADCPASCFK